MLELVEGRDRLLDEYLFSNPVHDIVVVSKVRDEKIATIAVIYKYSDHKSRYEIKDVLINKYDETIKIVTDSIKFINEAMKMPLKSRHTTYKNCKNLKECMQQIADNKMNYNVYDKEGKESDVKAFINEFKGGVKNGEEKNCEKRS